MADDVQIADTSSGDAPHDYTVPSSADFILKAAYGVFDGTLASGNFLPTLEIVSDSGHTVARSVGQQVTAGDSAEVSWFPFAPPASSGGGGSITEIESTDGSITVTNPTGPTVDLTGAGGGGGIQFGVNNTGSYLNVETTSGPIFLADTSTGPSEFTASGSLEFIAGNNVSIFAGSGKNIAASPQLTVTGALLAEYKVGLSTLKVIETTSAGDLGFFGKTPVAQQPTPITLADVIAVLQAYGLTA